MARDTPRCALTPAGGGYTRAAATGSNTLGLEVTRHARPFAHSGHHPMMAAVLPTRRRAQPIRQLACHSLRLFSLAKYPPQHRTHWLRVKARTQGERPQDGATRDEARKRKRSYGKTDSGGQFLGFQPKARTVRHGATEGSLSIEGTLHVYIRPGISG